MGNTHHDGSERPDPETLLDRYQLRDPARPDGAAAGDSALRGLAAPQPGQRTRGRLRVYLGMSAGVGKTYAMLNEGRRRKERGTDVVVGYVEAHGRPLTVQQIGDLEIVPRQRILYHGIELEEMDTAAILARSPAVALVDELAHANVPGSRHEKRYQDVEDLRAAGITVLTTLNIQHLEGLNDIVEAITGIRQRETVPDRVLDEADAVELVDIAPEALRARMRHGNIYPPRQATAALDRYFTESNLTALRELALRRVAEKTETELESLMRGSHPGDASVWATTATERVMVAFDDHPRSQQLLRDGWRLARALKAPVLAVSVVPPARGGQQAPPSPELECNIRLAEDLGEEVLLVPGRDVVAELERIARERHVTQMVIGQPGRSRRSEFWRRSIVNRLLRLPLGADIHIVPHDRS